MAQEKVAGEFVIICDFVSGKQNCMKLIVESEFGITWKEIWHVGAHGRKQRGKKSNWDF